MNKPEKELIWLRGEIKTPPFSAEARVEAGVLLRRLQRGELLSLPHSRPMTSIGECCHELRIRDRNTTWRIFYHVDTEAIVLLEVIEKKTRTTPRRVIETCSRRLDQYRATRSG